VRCIVLAAVNTCIAVVCLLDKGCAWV
jgi:hypothetical protein